MRFVFRDFDGVDILGVFYIYDFCIQIKKTLKEEIMCEAEKGEWLRRKRSRHKAVVSRISGFLSEVL